MAILQTSKTASRPHAAASEMAQPVHRPALGAALLLCGIALLGLYAMSVSRAHRSEATSNPPGGAIADVRGRAEAIEPLAARWLLPAPDVVYTSQQALEAGELGGFHPTPVRVPSGRAERISIPRIAVDSPVEEVALVGNEWPVPKFAVGHLGETGDPGDPGNAVFAGHLTSLSSGNVFARLGELEIGHEVRFISAGEVRLFRVVETRLVRNTDVSILGGPVDQALVTLITCAGRWIPRENDYDQRRIVVAAAVTALDDSVRLH